jgi:hypothetical protein
MDPPNIKYYDEHSVIVINPNGQMRQLFTPFKAQVVVSNSAFKINTWVYIEEVLLHEKHRIIYRIGSQWWPYDVFKLIVKF